MAIRRCQKRCSQTRPRNTLRQNSISALFHDRGRYRKLFSESLVRSRRRRDGLRARGHAVQRPQDHRLLHIIAAGAANSKKLSAVPSDSSCFRAARKDLPRRNRLEMPLVGNAQRSVLLNLPGLHSGPGDVKARIFCGLNVIEFRRVALARNFLKGAHHSSMSCIVSRHAKSSSGAGSMNTDKVPPRMPDHRIKDRRPDLFNMRPVIANRLPKRIQILRQDATSAKEYGMQLQARQWICSGSAWLSRRDNLHIRLAQRPIHLVYAGGERALYFTSLDGEAHDNSRVRLGT